MKNLLKVLIALSYCASTIVSATTYTYQSGNYFLAASNSIRYNDPLAALPEAGSYFDVTINFKDYISSTFSGIAYGTDILSGFASSGLVTINSYDMIFTPSTFTFLNGQIIDSSFAVTDSVHIESIMASSGQYSFLQYRSDPNTINYKIGTIGTWQEVTTPVPEPETFAMLGLGLLILGFFFLRRNA